MAELSFREKLNMLLKELSKGNAEALDGILTLAGSRMLSLALGILKNRADAEDCVQESFLKLARGAGSFREGTNGYAFLMRIVRNTALDFLRKRKSTAAENIDDFFSLADDSANKTEEGLVLKEAISRLPSEYKRLIYYRYYLGYTVRETAKELNLSKSAVARATEKAEEMLKNLLKSGIK